MNNNIQKHVLVEGSFSIADTREILVALLNDKINYHKHRNFSHEERYGKPDEHSVARLGQLQETKAAILKFLDEQKGLNRMLHIHSDIVIEIK